MTKKQQETQQQNKNEKKTLAGAGIWIQDLSHPKGMRYFLTTESTKSIDCCQAI